MNADHLRGQWKGLKGRAQLQWSRLTGDETGLVAGQVEQYLGDFLKRCGDRVDEMEAILKSMDSATQDVCAAAELTALARRRSQGGGSWEKV